jgi:hypothetical protein
MTSSSSLPRRGGAWLRVMHQMTRHAPDDLIRRLGSTSTGIRRRLVSPGAGAAAAVAGGQLRAGGVRHRDFGLAITGMYPVARQLDEPHVIEFDCTMMRADRS